MVSQSQGEKMNEDMVTEAGRQYPDLEMLDWLGTSETFLGIHRRFKASEGIATAHWRADRDTSVRSTCARFYRIICR